jgi:hypothetical protein
MIDPRTDALARLATGLEGIEEGSFVFEAAPQPLNEDVVHPAAAPVHGGADAGVLQRCREGEAGELAAKPARVFELAAVGRAKANFRSPQNPPR